MVRRTKIPEAIKMSVLFEAGYRCAIPTCRHTTTEVCHIEPYSKSKNNDFINLIALCPNCHNLYDRDKKIPKSAIIAYKHNLSVVNGRYSMHERIMINNLIDLISEFREKNPQSDVMYEYFIAKNQILYFSNLIIDGIMEFRESQYKTYNGFIDTSPGALVFTDTGRRFVDSIIQARKVK